MITGAPPSSIVIWPIESISRISVASAPSSVALSGAPPGAVISIDALKAAVIG